MKNGTFAIGDTVTVRSPLFSANVNVIGEKKYSYADILDLFSNPIIREAILTTNLAFYNIIKNNKGNKEQIINTFSNYLQRMSIRATPLALLSSVSLQNINNLHKLETNDLSQLKKHTRIDMDWLFEFTKHLEDNWDILLFLDVKINNTIFKTSNYVNNIYLSYYGKKYEDIKKNGSTTLSLKNTQILEYIIDSCKTFTNFNKLFKDLKEISIGVVEPPVIFSFLRKLINDEILITNLRPCIGSNSIFEDIIDVLKAIPTAELYYKKLLYIQKLLNEYDNSIIGEGEEIYLKIVNTLKKIVESKNYLQVDTTFSPKNTEAIKIELNDLNSLAHFLYKTNIKDIESVSLKEYKNKFVEKYGTECEIPLLELIDKNRGLGYPESYDIYDKNNPQYNNLKQYVTDKIINCYLNENNEISLIDEEIEQLNLNQNESNILNFELNFMINNDFNKNTNYAFSLMPNIGSMRANKMAGRFLNYFNSTDKDNLKLMIDEEKNFFDSQNSLLTELTYFPEKSRIANISQTNSFLDYELPIATTSNKNPSSTIELNDIVVGLSLESKFYLKSSKLNKQIICTNSHMMNPNICHSLYQFLYKINPLPKSFTLLQVISEIKNSQIYTPRITYKSIILSPKTWNIPSNYLIDSDIHALHSSILKIKKDYKIPNQVYLLIGDNRILININNFHEMHKIKKHLKKYSSVSLTEIEPFLLNSKKNLKIHEIVIPFSREDKENIKLPKISIQTNKSYIAKKYNPLGKWSYIKLYTSEYKQNELLIKYINPFIERLQKEGIIEKFFFIKYLDPNPHIRLRILWSKSSPNRFDLLNDFLEFLQNKEIIFSTDICSYTPEVIRYGGPNAIEAAETYFYHDSKFISQILDVTKLQPELDLSIISVITLHHFLSCFNFTLSEQNKLLSNNTSHKLFRKDYRNSRKLLMHLSNDNNNWMNLRENKKYCFLYELLIQREEGIINYRKTLDLLINNGTLSNNLENIVFSCIHMYCNRLYGTNRESEQKVVTLTSHTINDLSHFKSNVSLV
ncbi:MULTISPECIES: lantibiotic dehydratase [Bacillus]|nr:MULTISPECIES: lantibiotic dehydratase [Bacillus]EKS7868022.1 lantibiotic dehydratase [Bacillus cereus]MDA2614028.1 lantibiotic dehydratase [Bacillus cereus]MDF9493728.1 lantibiotic dehydratase [Bacillus cereus]MEB8554152.1 lantibiotic dehydratase [Bacillus cereus]MEB8650854.1 lantibiotic dehydratase [Bacillus cereus]